MSESNGERILKVGRQGRRQIQFGDDDPVFEIDVIEVYNQFIELDMKFRDEKGGFDKTRTADWNKACWGFVQQEVVLAHLPDQEAAAKINAAMSLTDARRFLKLLQEEADRLIPFFKLELGEKPSSPARSPTVAYSE